MNSDRADSRELRSLLAAVRRRWFRAVALRTAGRAIGAGAAVALCGLAVDRLIRPDGAPLVTLAVVTAIAAVAAIAAVLLRMQRRPGDRHVARFVEERAAAADGASMDDALVSAVDVVEGTGMPSEFGGLIVAEAVRRLRGCDLASLIPGAVLRRAGIEAAAGGTLLAVVLAVAPPAVSRTIDAARLRFFPGSIHVDVQPGDARVPAGTAFRIRATVRHGHGALTRATPCPHGHRGRGEPHRRDGP